MIPQPMIADIWRTHQLLVLGLFSMIIPFWFIKRIGLSACLFWSYILLSALYTFQSPWSNHQIQFRLDQSSAGAFAAALLIPLFSFGVSRLGAIYSMRAIEFIALANCIVVAILGYGIFNAHSMDASFAACVAVYSLTSKDSLFNVLTKWFSYPSLILILSVIFLNGGSTSVLAFGAGLFVYLILKKKYLIASILTVSITAFGFSFLGAMFLNDSGRIKPWGQFLQYFWDRASPTFGFGIGTFEWLGRQARPNDPDVFIWAHNDLLQLLFEGGVVAMVLFAFVLWDAVSNAYKRNQAWLLATISSITLMCLAQFPFRFAVSSVFICLIARAALNPIESDLDKFT